MHNHKGHPVNCFSDRHYTVFTGITEEEEEELEVADSFVAAFLSASLPQVSTQDPFLFGVTHTTRTPLAGRGDFLPFLPFLTLDGLL